MDPKEGGKLKGSEFLKIARMWDKLTDDTGVSDSSGAGTNEGGANSLSESGSGEDNSQDSKQFRKFCKRAFRLVDSDSSGRVDAKELELALRSLGQHPTPVLSTPFSTFSPPVLKIVFIFNWLIM